jgi:hypothetical protein
MRQLRDLATIALVATVVIRALLLIAYQVRETVLCGIYCSCITWPDAVLIAATIYCLIWERFDSKT